MKKTVLRLWKGGKIAKKTDIPPGNYTTTVLKAQIDAKGRLQIHLDLDHFKV